MKKIAVLLMMAMLSLANASGQTNDYLESVKAELQKCWREHSLPRALRSKWLCSDTSGEHPRRIAEAGENLRSYMAQYNHPNERGHQVVLEQIKPLFTP